MRFYIPLLAVAFIMILAGCDQKQATKKETIKTFCNPLDLDYRFQLEGPSRREAADPTVVYFRDRYYLFASKTGGYWHSTDLVEWSFVETNQIPTEEYAPTAIDINDTLYFLASSRTKSTLYKSGDPLSGKWEITRDSLDVAVWDPAFFLDDDKRLYLYWECSHKLPIKGIELDYKNNFDTIGHPVDFILAKTDEHGWEVPGDYNERINNHPWIEGAWVNKYKGKYYLQYAGPGTEYKSYSDGVYVAESPLGPYKIAKHNPFAYKPEGFAAGAGHGSTFKDKFGNYWHVGTMSISVKHPFERRIGLFPTFFDKDGELFSVTKFGDFPIQIPGIKVASFDDVFPSWMLLSYNKPVQVSSEIDSLPASNMVNEDIRTYWSAETGSDKEWAVIDLEQNFDVSAIQINFAEHETKIYGRPDAVFHRYTIDYSVDNNNWEVLIDQSQNQNDRSHPYFQLPQKENCRYLRIRNIEVPDGTFAISGFRVFGKGNGEQPDVVSDFNIVRKTDRRSVSLKWEKVAGADGYNVIYGTDKEKFYHNYQVYGDTSVTINSLNTNLSYYFKIEPFNENGVGVSELIKYVE
ncbi:family 43 glycosylhydrolase [uncultured Sunxiuqinia sp.]|uniref:family 43 glycosylhydrolase n=1 Tax=uncultured Sunxiuqinia sp. TaxID=1573825 RepID=UPI002AA688E1|nr:family 43 glycosylhydrolase [uncultured Sunxiuqinia sp.]